jgi:hypothetical protein
MSKSQYAIWSGMAETAYGREISGGVLCIQKRNDGLEFVVTSLSNFKFIIVSGIIYIIIHIIISG